MKAWEKKTQNKAYSTLALDNAWTFFFSGFSNIQGIPLAWHRRQGAWNTSAGPGRGMRATVSKKRNGWSGIRIRHLSFTSVLAPPTVRTSPSSPLWDMAWRLRLLLGWALCHHARVDASYSPSFRCRFWSVGNCRAKWHEGRCAQNATRAIILGRLNKDMVLGPDPAFTTPARGLTVTWSISSRVPWPCLNPESFRCSFRPRLQSDILSPEHSTSWGLTHFVKFWRLIGTTCVYISSSNWRNIGLGLVPLY